MWPVARPGRELQLIMIIGPSGVQFSLQSYEYFQWQNRTTAKQEPNLSITRMITDRIGRHEFLLPINHNHYKFRKKRHLGQKSSSNLKISQLWLWLILVSSDEATRSITTHVPPGQDVSPSHAGYSPTLLPPPPLWHFIRLSWLISATHLYSWVKRGTVRNNKVLYKNKTHNLARLQMQTLWPWVHLTNHKATISPQEGRVYVESL